MSLRQMMYVHNLCEHISLSVFLCVCVHLVVRTNSCKNVVFWQILGGCQVRFPTSSQLGPRK